MIDREPTEVPRLTVELRDAPEGASYDHSISVAGSNSRFRMRTSPGLRTSDVVRDRLLAS